jgi:hypothetical protein
LKRWIVIGLERACSLLDRMPGQWGCRIGLSQWSADLDERWETGEWKEPA